MDQVEPPRTGSLDSVAAEMQASAADLDLLLHHLVDKLRAVPGLDPVVTYRRSRWRRLVGDIPYVNDLHSGSQPIEGIHVAVGAADYRLAAAASSITCRVETTGPAGAATSTVLPFARWIADMTSAVAERSRMAHESLAALENLIVYDRPH